MGATTRARCSTAASWRAADADADRLEYDVLYRPSVGEWQQIPLAVLTTETHLVFERYDLPADDNATIAIAANDGFNTVEATVTGLKLEGNLPPELYITSPQDGTFYYEGSNVMLIASAYDPEDGELPVEWESNLDGPGRPRRDDRRTSTTHRRDRRRRAGRGHAGG